MTECALSVKQQIIAAELELSRAKADAFDAIIRHEGADGQTAETFGELLKACCGVLTEMKKAMALLESMPKEVTQ